MWTECSSFEKVPDGVWLGTALETDNNNKKILVKIECIPSNGSRFIIVDGHAHFECDYLKLLAFTKCPELYEVPCA